MNKSSKLIQKYLLPGVFGGILACIGFFLMTILPPKYHWQQLPSPPEEAVAILAWDGWLSGLVQTKDGKLYTCKEGNPSCSLSTLIDQDQVDQLVKRGEILKCWHPNQNYEDFPEPPSSPGKVIDACKIRYGAPEMIMTDYLIMYEGNSFWYGQENGRWHLPPYGASFCLIMIFVVGGLVGIVLGLIIFSIKTTFPKQTS